MGPAAHRWTHPIAVHLMNEPNLLVWFVVFSFEITFSFLGSIKIGFTENIPFKFRVHYFRLPNRIYYYLMVGTRVVNYTPELMD